MANNCIFCGNPAGGREHICPQWVAVECEHFLQRKVFDNFNELATVHFAKQTASARYKKDMQMHWNNAVESAARVAEKAGHTDTAS